MVSKVAAPTAQNSPSSNPMHFNELEQEETDTETEKLIYYDLMRHSDSNSPIVSNKSDLSIFDFLIFYWFK
jgi:hypothetical protein